MMKEYPCIARKKKNCTMVKAKTHYETGGIKHDRKMLFLHIQRLHTLESWLVCRTGGCQLSIII